MGVAPHGPNRIELLNQQSTRSSMLNLIVAFQFVVVGNKLSANVPGNLKGEQRVNTQFASSKNKKKYTEKYIFVMNPFRDLDHIHNSPKPEAEISFLVLFRVVVAL